MKDRPILFSAPMVRAILEGRKTQTRRIVKPQPEAIPVEHLYGKPPGTLWWSCRSVPLVIEQQHMPSYCPYGQRGDRLWVREAWGLDAYTGDMQFSIKYRAGGDSYVTERNESDEWVPIYQRYMDGCGLDDKWDRWRPSIHMPRWASRITLEVTGVRVERLQDITEDDAKAEGAMHWWNGLPHNEQTEAYCGGVGPVGAFHSLWNSINKDRAPWGSNPWVWVVGFRRMEE